MALVMKSICLVVIAAHSFSGTYATRPADWVDQIPFNDCPADWCQNGGGCSIGPADDRRCWCPSEFTGSRCEVEQVDPCGGCQNGGGCDTGLDWKWKCFCPAGFTGSRCELKMEPSTTQPSPPVGLDACAGVVCQNWGICRSIGDAAVCSCPPAFTGQLCEVKEDPCLNYQCENGGTCQTSEGYPVCICPPGYSGNKCIFKDGKACANVECQNGGTCIVVGKDAVECHCALGFTGFNCEQQLCPTEPCPSGKECVREASSGRYFCRSVTTIAPLKSYPKKNEAHVAKPLLGILHFIVVANSFFIFFHVM